MSGPNTPITPIETRFLQPLDVLFLRGNKLFGDPGSFGESLVPPWPSVAAGAIRSRMLADEGVDLPAFAAGQINHPTLGTPTQPGTFRVTQFQMARQLPSGRVEALIAPPADLIISEDTGGKLSLRSLTPNHFPQAGEGLCSSFPLEQLPVLAQTLRGKAASGYWLTEAGWRNYLAGQTPLAEHLVHASKLWDIDARVGVGLDADTRSAADGRLFSVQAVAMHAHIGFLVSVAGASPAKNGTLRLGGDGRAAAIRVADVTAPEPDYVAISQARRCRIVLTTPGIFPTGWGLPGCDAEGHFKLGEISARLVSAAVPRADVVSGWDLANWQPKPAQRAAPTGSVYWLEDLNTTPDALRKLANVGLWGQGCQDAQRQAEGFNQFTFAAF
jgi:CRISPR-associated protein Cmr3